MQTKLVQLRHGKPRKITTDTDALAALERKSDRSRPDGCWQWLGVKNGNSGKSYYGGYGYQTVGGKTLLAHRLAYELMIAPIPVGLQIDHLCRNRACINPWHMEVVTGKINSSRGKNVRTECKQGHPFNKVYPNGWRRCTICIKAADVKHKEKVRNAKASA